MNSRILMLLTVSLFSISSHAEDIDLLELGIDPTQTVQVIENESLASDPNNGATINPGDGEIEEVTLTELKLAGRGFVNKVTGEFIALACVGLDVGDASCNSLRFTYFNPTTQKAYFLGRIHTVQQYIYGKKELLSEADQRNYAIKIMMKSFSKWRDSNRGMSQDARKVIQGVSFMGILGSLAVSSMFASAGVSLAVGIAVYPIYLVFTPMITGDVKLMNGNRNISQAASNKDGWNWSSKPARVRNKVFNYLFDYISGSFVHAKEIRAGAGLPSR